MPVDKRKTRRLSDRNATPFVGFLVVHSQDFPFQLLVMEMNIYDHSILVVYTS